MPLFGKSRLQKALEERDNLLRFIQSEITARKITPRNRDLTTKGIAGAVHDRLSKEGRDILGLGTQEEVKAIVTIPNDLGEAKCYFLYGLLYAAKGLYTFSEATRKFNPFSPLLWKAAAFELCKFLHYQGATLLQAGNLQDATQEFESALDIAQEIDYPILIVECLRGRASCEAESGRHDKAKATVRDAKAVLDIKVSDPTYPPEVIQRMQKMSQEFGEYLAE